MRTAAATLYQTNLGPMTAEQISDELTYCSYRHNRQLGLTQQKLARLFGDVPCELMEARYRSEVRAA